MTIVAIHQPNFFPWLGYFEKIARSDVFILLDDVQFPKTGGVWSNRVKVLINGEGRWLTAPVDRSFHGTRYINQMSFTSREDWRGKLLKTLVAAYRRAPCFDEAFAILEPLIRNPEENIARYNGIAVSAIAQYLGLPLQKFRWSSEFMVAENASERLISLTRAVGGHAYICGGGAAGYQEDAAFSAAGIVLIYQNFDHPIYPQLGSKEFVRGLSIIDALMNIDLVELRGALTSTKDQTRSL
jgi:hypothetical protein